MSPFLFLIIIAIGSSHKTADWLAVKAKRDACVVSLSKRLAIDEAKKVCK